MSDYYGVSRFDDIEDEIIKREPFYRKETFLDSYQMMLLRYERQALSNHQNIQTQTTSVTIIREGKPATKRIVDIHCKPQMDKVLKAIRTKLGDYAPSANDIKDELDIEIASVFYACEVQGKPSPKIK
jgi:hypothetical protein